MSELRRNHTGHRVGQGHHRAKHDDATVQRVRRLRAQGLTYQRISEQTGVAYFTVADWCRYATRWVA